ncbi:beta strand repeat-containing protein [Reyranella sp.]|uniref:beta strand repeat-containing protein n=1 Tax=Reyranella sp. TaxID=1929291 RepID=UPI003D0C7A53
MAIFTGTAADETITPLFVSATVTRIPAGSFPGAGADSLDGGGGDDTLDGGAGDDSLIGDTGDDSLSGGSGNDTLSGGDGNDTLNGGTGADNMNGGFGDDTYIVDNVGDVASEVAGGTDTVQASITHTLSVNLENLTLTGADAINGTGNAKDNLIIGNDANNGLSGLAGNDTLKGAGGTDRLLGGDGNDVLVGGTGADSMAGGAGNDTYYVDDAGDTAVEASGAGTDLVFSSISYSLAGQYTENLTLTGSSNIDATGNSLANTLTGNSGNNVLSGLSGNDTLSGGDGNDTLNGGTGADNMDGGFGDDTYIVDNAGDVAGEVAGGTDTVQSSITHTLSVNLENLTLTGANAINGTGNAKDNLIIGNDANNVLSGLAGNDTLKGAGGADTLLGGDGNDALVGGTGADSMAGGAGNDTYYVDDAGDTAIEANVAGTDLVFSSVSYSLAGQYVENLTLTGSSNINAIGNSLANTLTGNSGNNVLNGSTGADVMAGGAGNDTYFVDNAGDSTVEANGAGTDQVFSSISYSLAGQYVENLTLTGSGNTNGIGNSLANVISGNSGNNVLSGLSGADTLIGGDGNDTLDGGTGADNMDGGFGNDTYIVDNAGDVAGEVAAGVDTVQASVTHTLSVNLENLTLTGSASISGTGNAKDNVITGNSGNNVLSGLAGDDTLSGGDGNDTLDGGTGADNMDGGFGNDTYIVDSAADVAGEVAGGTDTVQASVTHTLSVNLENLTLTGSAAINGTGNSKGNVITGNSGNNVLSGLVGVDTLIGGDGNDTLDGGTNADNMNGGFGNDLYIVDNAGDVAAEVAGGTDTVQASVTHTLSTNIENLTLTGAAAINGTGNALDNLIVGNAANNVLSGLAGDDSLKGAGGADSLSGGDGNDRLDGGTGADSMDGGFGDDTYIVDNVGDVAGEVAGGVDTVQSSITHTLSVNLENLTLTGAGAINGTGNAKDNVITGNSGNNVLSGLDGNDTLNGGAGIDNMNGGFGNDTYIVDNAGDVAAEVAGGIDTVQSSVSYTLSTNLENLTLTGAAAINGTGNGLGNVITGNSADNVLSGLGGNDKFITGGGNDALIGGDGNDTFQFDTPLVADNFVTIVDFTVGADNVALSSSIFSQAGPVGVLAASAFFLGAAASDASDRIGYDSATGNMLYDADGNGAQAAVAFGSVTPGLAMTANQFTIV